jgi:hypothetical protein
MRRCPLFARTQFPFDQALLLQRKPHLDLSAVECGHVQ